MKTDRMGFIEGVAALTGAAVFGLQPRMLFGAERSDKPVVTAGVVTDLHYCSIKDAGTRFYRQSAVKLGTAVSVMNDLRPDFMIELGDYKDQAKDKAATLACLDRIESVFAGFKGDRFHVPGNHDFDCLTPDEFFARIRNAGQKVAEGYYSFVRGGITFIVLDGCYTAKSVHYGPGVKWNWTDANISPAQLKWLEAELEKAESAVVFCHQRLDNKARKFHALKNARQVRAVLERSGKVKSVLTGHDHIGGVARINGITYYTLRAMVEGSGAEENSFALASFYSDGSMTVKGWFRAGSVPG